MAEPSLALESCAARAPWQEPIQSSAPQHLDPDSQTALQGQDPLRGGRQKWCKDGDAFRQQKSTVPRTKCSLLHQDGFGHDIHLIECIDKDDTEELFEGSQRRDFCMNQHFRTPRPYNAFCARQSLSASRILRDQQHPGSRIANGYCLSSLHDGHTTRIVCTFVGTFFASDVSFLKWSGAFWRDGAHSCEPEAPCRSYVEFWG